MTEENPQAQGPPEGEPKPVVRDKRRIDPISGEVRASAGEQPAGAPPSTPGAMPGSTTRTKVARRSWPSACATSSSAGSRVRSAATVGR